MKVKLSNVGIIDKCEVEFVPGVNLIIGSSGSGKSTLMRCIYNMAANEFADSDISFGQNTMSIEIENGDNVVQYSRSVKTKGEKCFYNVNGEQYVKLGRQPLPAVTNALKIGSRDVNGDDINFNFNLQFSSPFLILGNQSTLYNVLTYRSTFDISSINDFYTADIRNNASETAASEKLKEQLESNLNSLTKQADQMQDIENVYSSYMACKHKASMIEDFKLLCDDLKQLDSVIDELSNLSKSICAVERACEITNYLTDLTKYKSLCESYNTINLRLSYYDEAITHLENALSIIQNVSQLDKLSKSKQELAKIDSAIAKNVECDSVCNDYISKESLVKDLIRQRNLLLAYNKCDKIVNTLSIQNEDIISFMKDAFVVKSKFDTLSNVEKSIKEVENSQNAIHKEMSKFDVCPLCGNRIHT